MSEKRDKDFLLRAYDVLSSEGFRRYVMPLIHERINLIEDRIVAEDRMDNERREARKELLRIVELPQIVKQELEDMSKET